jgi:hypothetical protein
MSASALLAWEPFVRTPPTETQRATWRRRWPEANWAELLEPAGVLEIDLDSLDAQPITPYLGVATKPCPPVLSEYPPTIWPRGLIPKTKVLKAPGKGTSIVVNTPAS